MNYNRNDSKEQVIPTQIVVLTIYCTFERFI